MWRTQPLPSTFDESTSRSTPTTSSCRDPRPSWSAVARPPTTTGCPWWMSLTRPAPRITGSLGGFFDVTGLAVEGSTAYLAVNYEGLAVVDISDPTSPLLVGWLEILNSLGDVAVTQSTVFVKTWSGLHVVDVSDPGAPAIPGSLSIPGTALAASDSVLYVGGGSLQVVDVSDPQRADHRRLGRRTVPHQQLDCLGLHPRGCGPLWPQHRRRIRPSNASDHWMGTEDTELWRRKSRSPAAMPSSRTEPTWTPSSSHACPNAAPSPPRWASSPSCPTR